MTFRTSILIAVALLTLACSSKQAQPVAQAAPANAPPAAGPADPVAASQPPATGGGTPAQPPANAYEPVGPSAPAATGQPPAAAPASYPSALPSGTPLQVRLDETLDTHRNRGGDPFTATLVVPVTDQGAIVVPEGARCTGRVVVSKASGRLKGRAFLGLTLDAIEINGRQVEIRTSEAERVSGNHKKRDWFLIGGGAGTGATIGAFAGGGPGALIGAGAGAAAGTVGAVATGKKNVSMPAETFLVFRLREPLSFAP